MKDKLIIVESPSKCKKIESYAGSNYKCLATCGHIYTLDHIKDIDFNNGYAPTYNLIKSKKKYLDVIIKFINNVGKENVYLATDPDREGEAIAWHLCQHCNLDVDTTKRIVFNEITKTAVCASLKSPTRIDMNMVNSQRARQTIDLIVGFKTCPILWKHLGIGDRTSPISSGRCQTPCLKIVYDLYEKEKHKNTEEKYKLISFFKELDKLQFSSIFSSSLANLLKTNKGLCDSLLLFIGNDCDFILSRCIPKKSILKTPLPLSTSLLQQKAGQYLGISPSTTMKTAQKLYEKGFITYMRTDSHRYSKDFITSVISFIKKSHYNDYLLDNPYCLEKNRNTIDTAQDGHESIRPTTMGNDNNDGIEKLVGLEKKLYTLIYYYVLQTFMKDAIIEYYDLMIKLDIKIKSNVERTEIKLKELENIVLKTTLKNTYYLGWKVVDTKYEENTDVINSNEPAIYNKYITLLKTSDDGIQLKNNKLKSLHITPYLSGGSNYYSESNLVKQLETYQIGRPSTYASLVDKIQKRHYVFKMDVNAIENSSVSYDFYNIGDKTTVNKTPVIVSTASLKNRLVIQELGKKVNDFCYSFFEPLFNYTFTASLEKQLDSIAKGDDTYETVCQLCDTMLEKCITDVDGGDKNISRNATVKTSKEYELGIYKNMPLVVKSGIYGFYAYYGKTKFSLRAMNMIEIEHFTYENVVSFIERQQAQNDNNLLRNIDDKISIWKGKKGKSDYIMIKAIHNKNNKYKKKPLFISLNGFDDDYLNCDIERLQEYIKLKTKK